MSTLDQGYEQALDEIELDEIELPDTCAVLA